MRTRAVELAVVASTRQPRSMERRKTSWHTSWRMEAISWKRMGRSGISFLLPKEASAETTRRGRTKEGVMTQGSSEKVMTQAKTKSDGVLMTATSQYWRPNYGEMLCWS
ncbi:hypothetical protein FRB93_010311 [Tulasnella sp. JGI-2019a]|nr:hypothetical protein FRB93_010311 [Tulasnella sp. JGI-2019a]